MADLFQQEDPPFSGPRVAASFEEADEIMGSTMRDWSNENSLEFAFYVILLIFIFKKFPVPSLRGLQHRRQQTTAVPLLSGHFRIPDFHLLEGTAQ